MKQRNSLTLFILTFALIATLAALKYLFFTQKSDGEYLMKPSASLPSVEELQKFIAEDDIWSRFELQNKNLLLTEGDSALFWNSGIDPENIKADYLITGNAYPLFKPSISVDVSRAGNGYTLYNAKYVIDDYSRRATDSTSLKTQSQDHFLFLGCSFTFGTGVQNNETFVSYFNNLRPRAKTYNLGIYGAGANDIYDDLKLFFRTLDVPRFTKTTVIYTALVDHIERSVCSLNCYRPTYKDWVLKKSNYEYNELKQEMERVGTFAESRPISGPILSAIGSVKLLDSIQIPPQLTEDQILKYVRLVNEIKKFTETNFKAEFYFVFYFQNYENWPRIAKYLDLYNIKYLDFSHYDIAKITNNRHQIVYDGHPSPLSNYIFAQLLDKSLPR